MRGPLSAYAGTASTPHKSGPDSSETPIAALAALAAHIFPTSSNVRHDDGSDGSDGSDGRLRHFSAPVLCSPITIGFGAILM